MAESHTPMRREQLPFWRQLRWNLVFYFVLLAVLPVLLVAAATLARTSAQARDQVYNQLDSVAQLKQDAILRALEQGDIAIDLVLRDPVRSQQFIDLALSPSPEEQAAINTMLASAVGESGVFHRLFFYTPDGTVIAASEPADVGKVVTRQPYYQADPQEDFTTPPFYGLATGALEMYQIEPFRDENGRLLGVMAGQIDVSLLSDIMLERTGLGETGNTYLVSRENSYLLTPSRFEGYPANRAYTSEGIRAGLNGETGRGAYLDFRDPAVPVFSSYRYIPDLEVALIAEIDQSEALIATRQAQTVGIVLAVVAGLAAVGVGFLTAQQISRPISRLTETAARIAGGELGGRVDVDAQNEVGVLAGAFNTMTGQLEELVDTLEDRVTARTRDMATTIEVGQLATGLHSEQELLPQITDFIRERFNLYYTQIYLVDEAERYAVLRAGTGDVGRQLLDLGHRLDLTATSIVARAAQTRRPVLVEDTEGSAVHLPNPLLPDTRSELAVPLISGHDLLGVLDMQAIAPGTFRAENAPAFEAMANQLAATMLGARAFEAVQEAVNRAESINRRLTAESWQSYLGRAARGERVAYQYDLEAPRKVTGDLPLEELLGDTQDGLYVKQPISLRGYQIGTILVGEDHLREWKPEELTLLEGVAEQVSQVTERYRTLDELAEREQRLAGFSRRLQQLQGITQALAAELSATEATYRQVLGQMAELVNGQYAVLRLLDPEGRTANVVTYNVNPQMAAAIREMPGDAGPMADAIRDRVPVRINNARADEHVRHTTKRLPDINSMLGVPVLGEARVIGTVAFMDNLGTGFTEDDEALASSFAAVLGRTLQASQLFEQTQTRARELQTIAEVSAAATATLDLKELLGKVVELTKERMGLYHAQVYMLDEPNARLNLAAGSGEAGQIMREHQHSLALNQPRSIVARAAREVEAVVVNNVFETETHLPNPLLPDTRSEMAVPLVVGNRVIGVLDVQSDRVNRFGEEEVRIMSTFAAQIATAAQNALAFTSVEESERLLRAIINATDDWIFVKDQDYRYLLVNQPFATFYGGRTPDEMAGKDDYDLGTPAYLIEGDPAQGISGFRTDDRAVVEGGETIHNPYDVVQFADGSMHTLDTKKTPMVDGTGKRIGVLGVARDVTERDRQRRRQLLAYELAQQLTTLLDPDALLQETVDRVAEAFGYYHAHVYLFDQEGERLVVRAGLGDAGAMMTSAGHSIPFHAERSLVARAARSSETVVENDVAGVPDHLPNPLLPDTKSEAAVPLLVGNRPVGVLDVQHNLTNHFTQDEVRTLNIVANQLAVALQNAELFGQTQQALAQTRDLYQTSRSLITSTELQQLLTTFARPVLDDGSCHVALLYPLADGTGEIQAFEVVGQVESGEVRGAPNGSRYPVDAFPALRYLLAHPEDMLHIADVTDSEHMDERSQRLLAQFSIRATTLIPLVTASTAWAGLLTLSWPRPYELSERVRQVYGVLIPQLAALVENRRLFDQAVQTAEQLREVDRLKNEFLANMSHELRTPLNSIIGYSELLIDDLSGKLDEMSIEDLKAIHSSGHHLLAIINDILDLAKIEAGRLQLNLEEIGLPDLIPAVVEMSRVQLKDKPAVDLRLELEDGLPTVKADVVRLRQIVWNLLSNAIKFTEKGHVRVITWRDGQYVYLSVEDTGIGIPEQYHRTIFDQFRQVDGSATRKAGGTGLGLTISRELVHLHGGDLWVESQVGMGSTFTVKLPHTAQVESQPVIEPNGSKRKARKKAVASGD